MGQAKFSNFWDASIKNTTGITNTRFYFVSTMVILIDASRLVLERTESTITHDPNLNPLSLKRGSFNTESRPAFILMIEKHHAFARNAH
jgi:hypothetical protein